MKNLWGLVLLAPCFVSCTQDLSQEIPASENYTREFISKFGVIDSKQDWNVVEKKSVTVQTSSPTRVKVYELNGDEYCLAADYSGVTGSKRITFDGLEDDDTEFIVSLDGELYTVANGGTVSTDGGTGTATPAKAAKRARAASVASLSSAQPVTWTVACEDLGGTYDYDFNDVVLRVSHVAGQDSATIVPMAAGGTLATWVCYTGTDGKELKSAEWHQHFYDTSAYNINDMVNTTVFDKTEVQPFTVNVGSDWSMTQFAKEDSQTGKFSIKVKRTNGETNTIVGPSQGGAPQMLVLPGDWKWPKEHVSIDKAYPGGTKDGQEYPSFGKWGENYGKKDWTKYWDDKNVMRPGDVTKKNPYQLERQVNGHMYVDLGLPSGTLWATCNIGAYSPVEFGDYFAWAETETKDYFDQTMNNYKYFKWDRSSGAWIKYVSNGGTVYGVCYDDDLTQLESCDDAATQNWGSDWRMPTEEEVKELFDNCDWSWVTYQYKGEKVGGAIVANKTDKSKFIFLPAAGYKWNGNLSDELGWYWTSIGNTLTMTNAKCLRFYNNEGIGYGTSDMFRCDGMTIRAVTSKKQ